MNTILNIPPPESTMSGPNYQSEHISIAKQHTELFVNRNYAIDFLRAVGAFSVVTLHMPYGGLPNSIVEFIFLIGRWAVPFFFMVSGYFFEKGRRNGLDREFLKTLKYLISLFVISNALYFFVALKTEFYSLDDILAIKTIILGDYIHLWFIGALIFAYILLWFMLSVGLERLLPSLIALSLLFVLLADPYSIFTHLHVDGYLPRSLLAVPFLFLGFLISKYKFENKIRKEIYMLLALVGLLLQFLESGIGIYSGFIPKDGHEFFLGTFIFSLGLFMLALSMRMTKENAISEIGRKYSLLIYLYHPLLIVVTFFLIKKFEWQNNHYLFWFNPLSVFAVTLLAIKLLETKYPVIFRILSGKIN